MIFMAAGLRSNLMAILVVSFTACRDEWQNAYQQTPVCCPCSTEGREKSKTSGTVLVANGISNVFDEYMFLLQLDTPGYLFLFFWITLMFWLFGRLF